MKKILLIIIVSIALTNVSTAQDTVYFRKTKAEKTEKKKNRSSEKTIIKISPLSFISGYIPVFVEREINPFLSIQVGAGITTHNYLKDWFSTSEFNEPEVASTVWSDGTIDTYGNENSLTDYKNRKSSLGYYFSGEPRIYFANEGIDGAFIGIAYSKARYNFSAKKIVTGPTSTGEPVFTNNNFSEYENITDILATFGTQVLYDRISLEYNTGLGLRMIKGQKYAYGRDNSGDFIDGRSNIEKTKLGFNLSIKIGYHF